MGGARSFTAEASQRKDASDAPVDSSQDSNKAAHASSRGSSWTMLMVFSLNGGNTDPGGTMFPRGEWPSKATGVLKGT